MDLSYSAIGARLLTTRWLARAPIWIFRLGLGCLLGRRLIMVEHRGRTSGRSRQVCLEVARRPAPDQFVLISGFAATAQWYQNLSADPRCFVWSGRIRRARARATVLTEPQSRAELERYRSDRPRSWRLLRGVIEEAAGHPIATLPAVRVTLTRTDEGR